MCLLQTGRGLADFSSLEMHSIAAYMLIENARVTKEEAEARETIIGHVRKLDREYETGIPALAEFYRAADDEMYGEV